MWQVEWLVTCMWYLTTWVSVILMIQAIKCIYASLHNRCSQITATSQKVVRLEAIGVFDFNKLSLKYWNAVSYIFASQSEHDIELYWSVTSTLMLPYIKFCCLYNRHNAFTWYHIYSLSLKIISRKRILVFKIWDIIFWVQLYFSITHFCNL